MRTAFCAAHGVDSEAEYKRRRRDAGELTYHAHLGLSDWAATAAALRRDRRRPREHGTRSTASGCASRAR